MENFTQPRIKDYDGDLTKRWYIQYNFKDPDTEKFVIFREWVSLSYHTKTTRYVAAKQQRDQLHKKLNEGYNPFTKKEDCILIRKAIEHIIEVKASVLRKRTWHTYRSIGFLFCDWLEKNGYHTWHPKQLTKYVVQHYFDYCLTVKKVTARTHNNYLRSLRTIFNEFDSRDLVEYNIFNKIKMLPEPENDAVAYNTNELATIRDHIEFAFPELWLCALFVHYAFIRPQELVRLQIRDLDFYNQTIKIPASKAKNKKTKTILMPDDLYRKMLDIGYNMLVPDLYVFSNGKMLTPGNKEIAPNRIFEAWLKNVKIPLKINLGIYILKHTGVGQLFDDGADARNIQMQLRHSSLEEVQVYGERYSKIPKKGLNGFFRKIDKI